MLTCRGRSAPLQPKRFTSGPVSYLFRGVLLSRFALAVVLVSAAALRAEDAASTPATADASDTATATEAPAPETRPVKSTLEMQVELHRRGFSCGSIDGVVGAQTEAALKAFQRSVGIADTGALNADTREHLTLTAPALTEYTISPVDVGKLHPLPTTWLEKSQVESMAYATVLESIAERHHTNPKLLQQLNPGVNWNSAMPGTKIVVPAVDRVSVEGTAASIVITLGARELDVFDDTSRVIAHFPVSIAHMVEKRPLGDLHVVVIIPDPDYTFDPAVFPESPEAQSVGHKLIIPPGPNNPVGVAWIGLDRPGYGIHGTPDPEKVGRTESHGCFRLANWDVLTLMSLVQVGMKVTVEP